MNKRVNLVSVDVATDPAARPVAPKRFRLLVIGDTGASAPGPLEERRPLAVDRDNFDQVFTKLKVEIPLSIGGPCLPAIDLDDLHPDRLHEKLGVFEQLRSLRRRLENPKSFAAAADEIRAWGGSVNGPATEETAKPAAPAKAPVTGGNVLDQMLGGSGEGAAAGDEDSLASGLARLVREVVRPYELPGPDPKLPELRKTLDAATSQLMRRILHDPAFLRIEGFWRGVNLLVRRLETGADLEIRVMHVTREELTTDLVERDDPAQSALVRRIVTETVGTQGGEPWAALVGDYTFAATQGDVAALMAMGQLCETAGCAFLAGGASSIVGCESFAATPDAADWPAPKTDAALLWRSLRELPETRHVALLAPRYLYRLPYAANASLAESFAFTEIPPGAAADEYPWGNGAFLGALALGRWFGEHGFRFLPDRHMDIADLPAFIIKEDGESRMVPNAEAYLAQPASDRLLAAGLSPLLSILNRPALRLAGLHALFSDDDRLAGPWG